MFIIKVPGINGLGKTKGCEKAPNLILDELKNIHSNEQGKIIDTQLLDLEEIHLDNGNVEESNKLIYKNSFDCFEEKPRVVFLGGDHSVSYSTTRAFFDFCQNSGKEPCLIVFDAHPDCMEPMRVESRDSSHTTYEYCKEPTHEEWLRRLIDDGFPIENILLVGVRNLWKDEIAFLKEKKIRVISMNQLLENLQDTCEIIMEFANGKELYVSVDIDFIDPAFAPGTGYPEPGGLSSRDFIYLVSRINKMKNLRAVDIVEINPEKANFENKISKFPSQVREKDENGLTVKLAAKVLSELI